MRAFILVAAVAVASGAAAPGPLAKVVELLKELKAQAVGDTKAEEIQFNRFACWCESQSAALAKSIKASKEIIAKDEEIIVEKRSRAKILEGEILEHEENIKKAKAALEKATKQREEERDAFLEESKELAALASSVEKAEAVISKGTGQGTNLLQSADLKRAFQRAGQSWDVMSLLIGDEGESFLQLRYSPASATIVGILRQMQNDFSRDLQKATETETEAQAEFEKLREALLEEIRINEEQIEKKEAERAECEEIAARTQVHKEQTQAALATDLQSFQIMEKMCKDKSADYKKRSTTRAEEVKAIQAALDILDQDAARDTFMRSQSTFLQLSARSVNKKEYCQTVRCKDGDEDCMKQCESDCDASCEKRLAAKQKVIELIDNLIKETHQQIEDDHNTKNDCKEHEQKYTLQHQDSTDMIARLQAKLAQLQEEKKALEAAKKEAEEQKLATEKTKAAAIEDRNEDHEAYKAARKEDEAAADLMKQAMEELFKFYKKGAEKSLLQGEPSFEFKNVTDAGVMVKGLDADFKGTEQSNVVIQLMTQIYQDINREIAEDEATEKEAVAAFEKLKAELEQQIKDLEDAIANISKQIADKDAEITQTETDIAAQEDRLHEATLMLDETENKGGEAKDRGAMEESKQGFKSMEYCKWVYASHDARKEKNLLQIDTLNNMKNFVYSYNVSPSE